MTFRVGQKVVCVDDSNDCFGRPARVSKNAVYTVYCVLPDMGHGAGIVLRETKANGDWGFRSSRFRPAVERKTDISVFTEILRTTKAPQLDEVQS